MNNHRHTLAIRLSALALILTPWLSGCSGPQTQPTETIELPTLNAFQNGLLTHSGELQADWWQQLGSPVLNRLMAAAAIDNLDIRQALLRIDKAQQSLNQQSADRWPQFSARASTGQSRNTDSSNGWNNSSGLSLSASYTVDLWSRRATLIEQSALDLQIARSDLAAARISLQGELASQYLNWLALRSRLQLAQQNLNASQEMEDLVRIRFEAGDASGIELAQQHNTTLSLQSSLMSLQQQQDVTARALAALLGQSDLSVDLGNEGFEQIRIPAIANVQPAALLEHRPDVQSATLTLRNSYLAIYVAESNRWPSLSLSAALSPVDLLSLAGDWTLSLTEALSVSLFDGGSSKAEVEAAKLDEQVARLDYRKTVISAMQETLDALEAVDYEARQTRLAEQTFDNNQQLLELARIRYDSGDTDFSDLLTSQRTFFSARDSLVSQRLGHLQALIELYGALGTAPEAASAG